MLIRHAEAAGDAGVCADVYAPFVTGSVASFEEAPPTPAEMGSRIARLSATHAWLVAEHDGAVVGFAYGGPHRERAAYRWATDVSVYVDGRFHRRGVGRALYATLFELLTRQGFRVACAGITLPNDASVALHRSMGFQPVGVYRRIGWKDGAWRDVIWWQRQLGPQDVGRAPEEPGPPVRLMAPEQRA
jgi:phosphinothricin acetyltransferase